MKINRNDMYKDANGEKKGRGALRAAVERSLNRKVVVILDECNHIKGLRYELHCRVKEMGTTHCVVYCDVPADRAKEWNDNKPPADRYDAKILQDLTRRMEVPCATKRWDAPLFTLKEADPTPCTDIQAALFKATGKRSVATAVQTVEDTGYVYELDRLTQDINKALLLAAASSTATATPATTISTESSSSPSSSSPAASSSWSSLEVSVPNTTAKVLLKRKLELPELRRLAQQFHKLASLRPKQKPEQVATSYVDYINANLEISDGPQP